MFYLYKLKIISIIIKINIKLYYISVLNKTTKWEENMYIKKSIYIKTNIFIKTR